MFLVAIRQLMNSVRAKVLLTNCLYVFVYINKTIISSKRLEDLLLLLSTSMNQDYSKFEFVTMFII